jgi:hypothetical protein
MDHIHGCDEKLDLRSVDPLGLEIIDVHLLPIPSKLG